MLLNEIFIDYLWRPEVNDAIKIFWCDGLV